MSTETLTFAHKIARRLRSRLGITNRILSHKYNEKKWVEEIKKLEEEVGRKRIKEMLDWYFQNLDYRYLPQVHSASSFRLKFLRIEYAKKTRERGEKKTGERSEIRAKAKEKYTEEENIKEGLTWDEVGRIMEEIYSPGSWHMMPRIINYILENRADREVFCFLINHASRLNCKRKWFYCKSALMQAELFPLSERGEKRAIASLVDKELIDTAVEEGTSPCRRLIAIRWKKFAMMILDAKARRKSKYQELGIEVED